MRNEDIREELQVFSINDKIQTYRREWLRHVDRMEDGRLPKVAFRYRPFGTRAVGRPRARWRDALERPDQAKCLLRGLQKKKKNIFSSIENQTIV